MTEQKLSIVHLEDSAFVGDGLRKCFEYRDLGIKEATGARGRRVRKARMRLVTLGRRKLPGRLWATTPGVEPQRPICRSFVFSYP